MSELDGKVAIVTGGSSGIGEASARALAEAGARVVVTGQHLDRAKGVADSIAATGAEAMGLAFDTSDEAQVKDALATVVSEYGGIDILHNNAAITSIEFMMRDGMIHELDVDLWDQTMGVNVRGYMLCTKYAVPSMIARGGGAIINTASGAGMQGEVVRPAYGTSKAAVIGFTRSVATQYGKLGIRCNTVMPGVTKTRTMVENMPPAMLEMYQRHTLTPELAAPEDVANAVVFLASDRAAFITGITVPVDGGFGIHGPSYADEVAMWAAASGAEGAALAEKFSRALEARRRAKLEADDLALLNELLADDAVWHGAGKEDTRGKDELINRWNEFARDGGKAPQIEVADVYSDGTHVVGVLELSDGTGKTVRQANVFHLDADGKATEVWGLPADSAIADAFAKGETVSEHPNVARFRAAEEARARNTFGPDDVALIADFLLDDVHWISAWGEGPTSREQVLQQFASFKEATGGTMQLTLNEIFADDTHAVSLVRLTADRPDRPDKHMDVKEANVFHLDAEGRAIEFWGVADDQAAINSFWM
jgi:NAD(P)-dependent dehydrogenase (short-subunit alcohol dehydrogenase family)/ketosteroid isomerase-like protein